MVDKIIQLVKDYQTSIVIPYSETISTTLQNSQDDKYKGTNKVDLTGVTHSIGTHLVDFAIGQYVLCVRFYPVVKESVLDGLDTEDDSEG